MSSKNIYIETNSTIPYFYIIQHKISKKMYAGARWSKGCHPDDFMTPDGYKTSSNTIKHIIKDEGLEIFDIIRIDTNLDKVTSFEYESLFLQTIDCAKSDDWYNKYNNSGNITQTPEIRFQIETTNLMKYGYKHSVQSPIVKLRAIDTNMLKYGVPYAAQYPSIKMRMEETNLLKYGFKNPFQVQEFKDKIRIANLENLGYEYPMQSPIIQAKSANTYIKNYGVDHPGKIMVTCPWCDKTGGLTGMYNNHFDKCLKNPNYIPEIYNCVWCDVSTINKGHFVKNHMDNCKKNPNYIKPVLEIFSCKYCDMKSTSKGNLSRWHNESCKYKINLFSI